MKNRKLLNTEILMRISTFMVIAAIIFDNVPWLPKIAGIAIIISSILAMIEAYKDKSHIIKCLLNILLITAALYMIIT